MKSTYQIELTAGIFLLLGVGALIFLAVQTAGTGGLLGEGGYEVRARFSNVGGLQVGSDVKMAGVTIGSVAAIRLDPQSLAAVVTLQISDDYDQLPQDTSAAVYTSGLLGDQYIGLQPGGMEEPLQDGDWIMITQSAVILEQLIGKYLFNAQGNDGGKQ